MTLQSSKDQEYHTGAETPESFYLNVKEGALCIKKPPQLQCFFCLWAPHFEKNEGKLKTVLQVSTEVIPASKKSQTFGSSLYFVKERLEKNVRIDVNVVICQYDQGIDQLISQSHVQPYCFEVNDFLFFFTIVSWTFPSLKKNQD